MGASASPSTSTRRFLLVLLVCVPPTASFACGSRTALPAPEPTPVPASDASIDTRRDGGRDALADALPTIDARPRDASRVDCPDADGTLVYLITEQNELLAFDAPTSSFRRIGRIACPVQTPGSTPFSMAVDRSGVAYVLFNDGNLFQVSTLTAACIATPFVARQRGFETFGMGFSSDNGGPEETLYIAADDSSLSRGLARIDLDTFTIDPIGAFEPAISNAELTGTGDGRLFAFYDGGASSFIGEVDKSSGAIIAEDELANVRQGRGWAFAYWGGDFYTFTSPNGGGSTVTRFRPSTKQISTVAQYASSIVVGAGVSTCAPQQ